VTAQVVADWQAVHTFWFGDATHDPARSEARSAFWFRSAPKTDDLVRERFATSVAAAARGDLDAWRDEPRSALARVIVLDQFPRNIWRGTAEAFAHDAKALLAAEGSLAQGHLASLSPVEQGFLVMPFQHVESLERQQESVRLYRGIVEAAPAPWKRVVGNFLKFAQLHLELIERFGRFPHRNAILGRTPTANEAAYLAAGGESFGQQAH
jgi:uncharacterized protein (DUF924 family)